MNLLILSQRLTDVAPDTKPNDFADTNDPRPATKTSSTTSKSLGVAPEPQSLIPALETESRSIKAIRGAKKLDDGVNPKKITENVEGAITDDGDADWEDMDDSDDSADSDDSDEYGFRNGMDDSDMEDLLSGHGEYERNMLTTLMNTNFGYKSGEGMLPDGTGYEYNFHSDSDW